MTTTTIHDHDARSEALDPRLSFIVQAPAGSGKTELLTQRYLMLLGNAVTLPEEIIAITFTKKAAGEMKKRIIHALQHAKECPEPEHAHGKKTWQLAREVLARDQQLGWHLLVNPNRLRIQTIDALCASLAAQMPLLSQLGAQPAICEDAEPYYAKAASELLNDLEADVSWAEPIADLLNHVNNDLHKAQKLLIEMLRTREQWLPHIASHISSDDKLALKNLLENNLQTVVADILQRVYSTLADYHEWIITVVSFAAKQVEPKHDLFAYQHLRQLSPDVSTYSLWKTIADLVLRQDGEVRKTVNITQGFPAPSNAKSLQQKEDYQSMKTLMLDLLANFAEEPTIVHALQQLRHCPPPRYTDDQWRIIKAAATLLPQLVAKLWLIFATENTVDFTEMSHAALHAMGDEDAPSDLALRLDYQIQHILVDEFQDTSKTQFRLLTKLTEGWQDNDGRTLFLVGDPMQSIYRFRQAEVGLFIQTREQGLGAIKLTPIHLTMNFRSTPQVIHWVNQTFATLFPTEDDRTYGAVRYHSSVAAASAPVASTIAFHPVFTDDDDFLTHEGRKIVEIIQQCREQDPEGTLAILVKAKTHLQWIIPLLQEANLRYQAIEISPLFHRPVVQDLLALTTALLHFSDRIAWLSVLRAPWCGLTLEDLYLLAGEAPQQSIWDQLQQTDLNLSPEGQQRLASVIPILRHAIGERRRTSLRCTVESTWKALNGPLCLTSPMDLADANAFFDLLEQEEYAGDLPDLTAFLQSLHQLFANPDHHADGKLQIMTMHKAKGLEFDTVILPGLNRQSRRDYPRLLEFSEYPCQLLAPIKAFEAEEDPINSYLKKLQQQRSDFEQVRLLYVGATRAKHNLHLLGTIKVKQGEIQQPQEKTLLSLLWPHVIQQVNATYHAKPLPVGDSEDTEVVYPSIRRLALDYFNNPSPLSNNGVKFNFNNEIAAPLEKTNYAKEVGIFIHRLFKQIAEGTLRLNQITLHKPGFFAALTMLGIPAAQLPATLLQIERAIVNIQHDPKSQWIFNPAHQEAAAEWAITRMGPDAVQRMVIDRTFIDDKGVRWIIDYKTDSLAPTQSLSEFLQAQQAEHGPQLHEYAQALQLREQREIKLGLYFPMIPAWCEWEFL